MSSEILTEVETCMIRIALRHMADHTPDRPRDEGLGKRDYHRLARSLDRFCRMEITQYLGYREGSTY